ncbi:putative transcription factor bZIP family [Helianthus annuus]|nr:putative transcription factor bZIP family [Helianthus annuus]
MSPVLSEILRSGFTINSSLRRRTHLVQSLSVVFLYCGNSSQIGSEEDLMDLKKRKRMQSNRESARKSRMRKQKHLDDLTDQINQMKKDNAQILATINMTTPQYVKVEAENSVLRAQMSELSQRLDYLNEIINLMSYNSTSTSNHHCMSGGVFEFDYHHDLMNNPWSAAEMLQY